MKFNLLAVGIACLAPASMSWAGPVGHVEVGQAGATFTYTLFNDGSKTSPNFLSLFHLSVDAPISVSNTPDGWDYTTDNATYVDWFSTDAELPYPHDVAPGTSLGGFTIVSAVTTAELLSYTITSFDHVANAGGPFAQGLISAPVGVADVAAVPEPGVLIHLCAGLLAIAHGSIRGRKGPSTATRRGRIAATTRT